MINLDVIPESRNMYPAIYAITTFLINNIYMHACALTGIT